MISLKKTITIIIPCFNEEKGIGKVIDSIPTKLLYRMGYYTDILVIDNSSTDDTSAVALARNVRVVHEPKKGKGYAIRRGMRSLLPETDYVVMMDGDNTYKAREIPRMIEPLANNFCDVVVGSRLGGKINKGSLKITNRLANWGFTFLVRHIYMANVTDVLSGFFAWKKKVVKDLHPHLTSSGFAIEMEMITKMVKLKHEVYSVPITYDVRVGHSKVSSVADGLKILGMFFRNLSWTPDNSIIKKPKYTPSKTLSLDNNI